MTIFSLFQSASFNRFQMSDIVKFGENISIIQKRATFEKNINIRGVLPMAGIRRKKVRR